MFHLFLAFICKGSTLKSSLRGLLNSNIIFCNSYNQKTLGQEVDFIAILSGFDGVTKQKALLETYVISNLVKWICLHIKAHSYPGRVFPYNQRTTLIHECYVYTSFIEIGNPQLQLSHCQLKLNYYNIAKYIYIYVYNNLLQVSIKKFSFLNY